MPGATNAFGAARVVPVHGTSNLDLAAIESGETYSAPIRVQQSAGTLVDALVWSLRNTGSTKAMRLQYIIGNVYMAGLVSAALGGVGYYLDRVGGSAPTGGQAAVITPHAAANSATVAACRYLDTGLTAVAATAGGGFDELVVPGSVAGASLPFFIDFRYNPLVLAPSEGVGFRLANTAIALMGIRGRACWIEA